MIELMLNNQAHTALAISALIFLASLLMAKNSISKPVWLQYMAAYSGIAFVISIGVEAGAYMNWW